MVRLIRCHIVLLILLCGACRLFAANSAEEKAFNAAAKNFELGFWEIAAGDFHAFTTNFPGSFRVPEAILYQAEAVITNGQFQEGIELLSTNQNRAAQWEDKYLFWMAQAYLGETNYQAAAETFEKLTRTYSNSTNCLEASVGEAGAYARLADWRRVIALLEKPDGAFRLASQGVTNGQVAAGFLLLGEAQLAETNYVGGDAALRALASQDLGTDLGWRRWYLECRLRLAEGRADEASSNATNLMALARELGNPRMLAVSQAMRARVLERLNRLDDAIAAYKENLNTNAPAEEQRSALLKIAGICQKQGDLAGAVKTLGDYWSLYPASPAADTALLTLGEFQLKQYVNLAQTNQTDVSAATNLLAQSLSRFDLFLKTYTNSPLTGKALLDRGWCLWNAGQYPESGRAFKEACGRLSFSEDQAVARFKWADAQYMMQDFTGAVTNYSYLVTYFVDIPEVKNQLLELALYQTVQSGIAATNMPAVTNALQKVLEWYPDSFMGDHCLLLAGEGYSHQKDPVRARELFQQMLARGLERSLIANVKLAIARTFEQAGDWRAAITNYQEWIATYTNRAELPRAQFSLAWDTASAGQETNALAMFTSFVSQYPTNDLAQNAQWWIGDYYFNHGAFYKAEQSFQSVTNPSPSRPGVPGSDLTYEAQFMVGRAAMGMLSYKDANYYFTNLVYDLTCPLKIRIQARFAAGDACTERSAPGDTNRGVDLKEALDWFQSITQLYPTNALAPLAWGRMGDCYKDLAVFDADNYTNAVAAYQRVIATSTASTSARCQAKIGLGLIAEKRAEQKNGVDRLTLLDEALADYLDVFNSDEDLRSAPIWVKSAGLNAAQIAERLQRWESADKIYRRLQVLLPSLASTWTNKIAAIQKQLEVRDHSPETK